MTTRVGLHRGDFVFPSGSIGNQDWKYIPKETGLRLDSAQVHLPTDKTNVKVLQSLQKLTELHIFDVTIPILCWMAVAPLRTLFREFPILHISGTSGSGKTTLTYFMQYIFSGSNITSNLTTTTPYAISAHFMTSNAFPVWFDEYRPGARDDARKTLDQLLRDAYTGQVSTKGSMNQNRAEVTQILTDTPIIITGEDTLSEKSHVDRSIILNIPMEGKNSEAKEYFDWESPIAYNYLMWLHANYLTDSVILPSAELPDHLSPRQRHNFTILHYGYNLLSNWVEDLDSNWELPTLSLNLALHDAKTASEEDPIMELIRWAFESEDFAVFALEDEDRLGISPIELMRIQNAPWGPRLPLPFEKHTAFGRWLEDHLGATKERVFYKGKQRRVYVVDYNKVIE
jgi:hypothetical protein